MSTLSGWTQSSTNWVVRSSSTNSKDTVIVYNFSKENITNLRTYVTTLEMYKERYDINTQIIKALNSEIDNYKTLVVNKDEIIKTKSSIITINDDVNAKLTKSLDKYKKKNKRLPYWIGAGFVGGIVLCQLVK